MHFSFEVIMCLVYMKLIEGSVVVLLNVVVVVLVNVVVLVLVSICSC